MRVHRFLILVCCLSLASMAHAVIVMGPQGRNTSAPTGTLSTAGWQYEGQFGSFWAPRSPAIISSRPTTSAAASLRRSSTTTPPIRSIPPSVAALGVMNIPGTDLNIWKVTGTFSTFAPLYGGGSLTYGSEVGKTLLVTGRGTQRGEPLTLANARLLSGDGTSSLAQAAATPASLPDGGATDQKGWLWGPSDGVESWGTNTVSDHAHRSDSRAFPHLLI